MGMAAAPEIAGTWIKGMSDKVTSEGTSQDGIMFARPAEPSAESGYKRPKGDPSWDKQKRGWKDKRGNVWQRDKSGHGKSRDNDGNVIDENEDHWDVQYPKGGYDNVYDNRHVREGEGKRGRFSPANTTVVVESHEIEIQDYLKKAGTMMYVYGVYKYEVEVKPRIEELQFLDFDYIILIGEILQKKMYNRL